MVGKSTFKSTDTVINNSEFKKGGDNDRIYISIKDVMKEYETSEQKVLALEDINLDIEEGKFVSIVGPSGCGKSTLLKLISGLEKPTSGEVKIKNELVTESITDVGIVFQEDILLAWRNVLENIMLQAEIRKLDKNQIKKRALELISSVGLDGFQNSYPSELSGGMRQRVSICRALVHDSPLLLMDEPFSALDALTRDQMNLDLQQIWLQNKKTVLFITHSITDAIFLSDVVYVMSPRPGKLIKRVDIDLKRPRGLEIRESKKFGEYTKVIRETFESTGVLQGG